MEGVRALWALTFVRASALAVAAANLIWSGLNIVLVVRAEEHGASPASIGVLFALMGVGGLLGSLAAPAIGRRVSVPVIVIGPSGSRPRMVATFALTYDPYVLGVLAAIAIFPRPRGTPSWSARG